MTENEIAAKIVDAAYKVHTTLGPGLLESVYEAVLTYWTVLGSLETRYATRRKSGHWLGSRCSKRNFARMFDLGAYKRKSGSVLRSA